MTNIVQDPEPIEPYDRFAFWYSNGSKHSTDAQSRRIAQVLLTDAQWIADEYRRQRKEIADLRLIVRDLHGQI